MTRNEAVMVIYEVINSGIISEELEQELTDVAHSICSNSFSDCEQTSPHCEGCENRKS